MPIDLAVLAGTVVTSFLVPYLKDGAKKIADAVVEKGSAPAADYLLNVAKKVADRVKSVFTSEEDRASLTQLEKRPEVTAPLVQEILREKLEQDSALAQELDQLVNSPGPNGQSAGAQIANVVGDAGILYMPNANFSHAQHVNLSGVSKTYTNTTPSTKKAVDSERDGTKQ